MKRITDRNQWPATLLAFSLIPLSGFALDIYIPSLPAISADLKVAPASIQMTLSIFLISIGVVQLFIGSLLDSFGRYLPALVSLLLFSLASFAIALSGDIVVIDIMRVLQGIAVATIIVSKRAVFVDLYSGDRLKKYTSMFSVIWAAAPVLAPFVGGFLQVHFGWRSNFYFLGFWGLMFLGLELYFSGESIRERHPFKISAIASAYGTMIKTRDFTVGLFILGLAYGMIMVYNMASPFLIEGVMHYSPAVTGNLALVSGLSVMSGGMLSRRLISKPFFEKILTSVLIIEAAGLGVMSVAAHAPSLYTIAAYVILIHMGLGFLFNSVLSYVLTRFPHLGGKASGLAGGSYIVMTSALSQLVVGAFTIKTQVALGVAYVVLIAVLLLLFVLTKWQGEHNFITRMVFSRKERVSRTTAVD